MDGNFESYNEQILQSIIDGEPYVNDNPYPSRIEQLLMELKEVIEQGGSGFTPTTEQLASINSGITSEDVEQISTNENNILTLQASALSYADITIDLSVINWLQDAQGIYYSTPIILPMTAIYAVSITSLIDIPINSGLIARIDGNKSIGLYANTGTWTTGQTVKIRAVGIVKT